MYLSDIDPTLLDEAVECLRIRRYSCLALSLAMLRRQTFMGSKYSSGVLEGYQEFHISRGLPSWWNSEKLEVDGRTQGLLDFKQAVIKAKQE